MKEVWEPISGYENLYEVSNLGRVKSVSRTITTITGVRRNWKERILKNNKLHNGSYCYVVLYKNGKNKNKVIHRLVAEAFLKNHDNKPEVNHIDGNGMNNRVDNLEWVTRSENQLHAYKIGLQKPIKDHMNKIVRISVKKNRKRIACLNENGKVIGIYPSIMDAERKTGVHNSNIVNVLKERRKTAGGYKWKYM